MQEKAEVWWYQEFGVPLTRDIYQLQKWSESHLAVPDSLRPHGLYSPWTSPHKNTGLGYPFPSPRDHPNPGIVPRSPPLQADSLPGEPQGKSTKSLFSFSVLRHLFSYSSGGQKFKISFTGTKWRCQQGHIPLEALEENLFLPLLPSGGCWLSGTSGPRSSDVTSGNITWSSKPASSNLFLLHFHMTFSPVCLCQTFPFLFQRWPVVAFWAYPDNPGQSSHFKTLNLITFV